MPAREANKSAALDQVFDELKTILGRHAKLFTEREGVVKNKRDYHLILQKPLVIGGRLWSRKFLSGFRWGRKKPEHTAPARRIEQKT